jgi:hypothetical protein
MRRLAKVGATIAGGVVAGAVAGAAIAGTRWNRATAGLVKQLTALPTTVDDASELATFTVADLEGLPSPVVRYFTFALIPDQPLVRRAMLQWEGEFRMRPKGKWTPFTATQHFTTRPPGFVWDATIRVAPFVAVLVRDGYVGGEGVMLGKVAGVVPVADQRGTPEMAAGALSRYLGEAVWLPTALLPSERLSWTAIDDRTARATLTDGPNAVSADFHFGRQGEIVGLSMTRYRDVDGRGVLTPFEARITGQYQRLYGMMIPSSGEIGWVLPQGQFTYWRGRMSRVEYDFTRPR